jgi:hypothetical protein
MVFTQDYHPGKPDSNGQFMGGTEALWLAGHRGKLYAAIGYAQDRAGDEPVAGAQILRKDAAGGPWQVDHSFGRGYLRVESLVSFTFTTDSQGTPLGEPAHLLVASPSGLPAESRTLSVFVRDDVSGQWLLSPIAPGSLGIRSFGSYIDKVTGVHSIFAGANQGGVYRGAYDPAAPGGIRWEGRSERVLAGSSGQNQKVYDYSRVLCFAEANGELYMAARIADDESGRPSDGGLYRRVDGPEPRWELVDRWPVDPAVLQSRYLRGLTAVPDPRGGERQVLLAAFEYPGVIQRFSPEARESGIAVGVEQELDIKAYFNRVWDTPLAVRRGAIAAYNRFLPVADPASGEPLWLCGAWVERPGSPNPPHNGSVYLIRHLDGSYDWGYVYDAAHPVPAGQRLTGTRDIEPSPFAEEHGRVYYFCGYDGGAGPSHNTAWIYRGELPHSKSEGGAK